MSWGNQKYTKSIPGADNLSTTLTPRWVPSSKFSKCLQHSKTSQAGILGHPGPSLCPMCIWFRKHLSRNCLHIFPVPKTSQHGRAIQVGPSSDRDPYGCWFLYLPFWRIFSSTHTHRQVLQDATSSSGSQAYEVVLVSRSFLLALREYFLHGWADRMLVTWWAGLFSCQSDTVYVQGSELSKVTFTLGLKYVCRPQLSSVFSLQCHFLLRHLRAVKEVTSKLYSVCSTAGPCGGHFISEESWAWSLPGLLRTLLHRTNGPFNRSHDSREWGGFPLPRVSFKLHRQFLYSWSCSSGFAHSLPTYPAHWWGGVTGGGVERHHILGMQGLKPKESKRRHNWKYTLLYGSAIKFWI